jgi:hypothetical protein
MRPAQGLSRSTNGSRPSIPSSTIPTCKWVAGPLLLRQYAIMRPHVDRYGIYYATALIRELPSEVLSEHLAIVEAIEAGDAEAAERAAVTNWRNAAERFAADMREWGERGHWEVTSAVASRDRSGG